MILVRCKVCRLGGILLLGVFRVDFLLFPILFLGYVREYFDGWLIRMKMRWIDEFLLVLKLEWLIEW